MRRLHFIVNPAAGRGRALTTWNLIHQGIEDEARLRGLRLHTTHSFVGQPTEFTLDEQTILVSVGGDGSVHHVAREALKRNLRLAVVPAGTGNDFAKNLHLPFELPAIIDLLLTGEERTIDVIRINDEFAFNLAGYGLDAEVVEFIEKRPWLKKVGRLGYGFVVPMVLWRHQPFGVSLFHEEGTEEHFQDVCIFAVANGALFGGGMNIAPTAKPDDGMLDIILASGLGKWGILKLFPKIYQGTHISHPAVTHIRGRRFSVRIGGAETAAEYDGESYPLPPHLDIEACPKLRLLMPNCR